MVRVIDARAGDRIDRLRLERFTRGDLAASSRSSGVEGEVYRWIMRIVRDRGRRKSWNGGDFWRIYKARRVSIQSRFGAWAGASPRTSR